MCLVGGGPFIRVRVGMNIGESILARTDQSLVLVRLPIILKSQSWLALWRPSICASRSVFIRSEITQSSPSFEWQHLLRLGHVIDPPIHSFSVCALLEVLSLISVEFRSLLFPLTFVCLLL